MITKKNERNERNEEIERILMDEEIKDCYKEIEAENRRLSEENKALKNILKRALDDMQMLFDEWSDVCCNICESNDCDYDTICRWRGYNEALRLIGDEKL